jgi:hypothetical protein
MLRLSGVYDRVNTRVDRFHIRDHQTFTDVGRKMLPLQVSIAAFLFIHDVLSKNKKRHERSWRKRNCIEVELCKAVRVCACNTFSKFRSKQSARLF